MISSSNYFEDLWDLTELRGISSSEMSSWAGPGRALLVISTILKRILNLTGGQSGGGQKMERCSICARSSVNEQSENGLNGASQQSSVNDTKSRMPFKAQGGGALRCIVNVLKPLLILWQSFLILQDSN